MPHTNTTDLRLAVLIDADNVPAKAINWMMPEIANHGKPTIKRIYGDFTSNRLNGWKSVLNQHAITPMQAFGYTTGKNATDSALIIDAMDMLHLANVDGFFIVSSDSDFTKLATRLREGGKLVYGMGQQKTPEAFIKACEKFIYLEVLMPAKAPAASGKATASPSTKPISQLDARMTKAIISAVEGLADEGGWVHMSRMGDAILKQRSDFDVRNFGYKRLTDLLSAIPELRVESRENEKGVKNLYVKVREKLR